MNPETKNDKAIEKRPTTDLAEYGSFELEDMEEAEKELPVGSGGFFKAKEGKNVIRMLPPRKGEKAIKIWHLHWFSAGGERQTIVCPKNQANERCELCAMAAKLRASGNRADAKLARAYEPRSNVYMNIVDMKNPEKGVQIFKATANVFKDIRSAIDISGEGSTFSDPKKGYNMVFVRQGTGLDTEYKSFTLERKPSELPDAMELITNQPNLENVEKLPDDEAMEAAVEGDFEDDRGGGKGKKDKREEKEVKGRRVDVDDDEDENDDLPL